MTVAAALDFARRFVADHFPQARAAVLAGSRASGEATADSDYDLVLFFDTLPDGAWRAARMVDGRRVELFAHDPGTFRYFCREVDRPSGVPALPSMIAEGIAIVGESDPLFLAALACARQVLADGPPPLDEAALAMRRFAVGELAGALEGHGRDARLAAGAALYGSLADFVLRAAGRWSGSGKALQRQLAAYDANLAVEIERAFLILFSSGDAAPVQALVDTVLSPYGGRLYDGFFLAAPASWRSD